MRCILVRRTGENEGTIEAVGEAYPSFDQAADAAGEDLVAHGLDRERARGYVLSLKGRPVGTMQLDPTTGLVYRVLEAHFTPDRRAIVPGLRVLDYDRREGAVRADQFMTDELISPGGKLFDGWYYVLPDGQAGYGRQFNGERLKAL